MHPWAMCQLRHAFLKTVFRVASVRFFYYFIASGRATVHNNTNKNTFLYERHENFPMNVY